jgi:hypothetical protein
MGREEDGNQSPLWLEKGGEIKNFMKNLRSVIS